MTGFNDKLRPSSATFSSETYSAKFEPLIGVANLNRDRKKLPLGIRVNTTNNENGIQNGRLQII
jgi:hypothetical protein